MSVLKMKEMRAKGPTIAHLITILKRIKSVTGMEWNISCGSILLKYKFIKAYLRIHIIE